MANDNQDPAHHLQAARDRLDDSHEHIMAFSQAADPNTVQAGPKKSARTVATYTDTLRRFEDHAGQPLTDLTTEDVIRELEALDVAQSTAGTYSAALRAFYAWHDGHDVDPEGFTVSRDSSPSIDPQTVLTGAEFHALRQAADNPRDRCIIDLLGFTGQRIRVLQTLRVRDVKPQEGQTGAYYINTDADGLKDAERAMRKRPLLGAKRSVMDWLEYHPTGLADDYLLTTMPSTAQGEPGSMVSYNTIRRAPLQAARRTDLWDDDADEPRKPINPHAFRHYFTTVAKREYGMDSETVKKILGHSPESNIMETTYEHLSDDDVIAEAEAAFDPDAEEEAEASRAVPPTCRVCSEPLEPHYKRCPRCDEPYGAEADRIGELEAKIEELEGLLS